MTRVDQRSTSARNTVAWTVITYASVAAMQRHTISRLEARPASSAAKRAHASRIG
jgi:hypothetical protein